MCRFVPLHLHELTVVRSFGRITPVQTHNDMIVDTSDISGICRGWPFPLYEHSMLLDTSPGRDMRHFATTILGFSVVRRLATYNHNMTISLLWYSELYALYLPATHNDALANALASWHCDLPLSTLSGLIIVDITISATHDDIVANPSRTSGVYGIRLLYPSNFSVVWRLTCAITPATHEGITTDPSHTPGTRNIRLLYPFHLSIVWRSTRTALRATHDDIPG